ncbi:MAG: protein-L-isoaspartate O-methyltransferase family protein [Candidatus Paceibacterota bacterium]
MEELTNKDLVEHLQNNTKVLEPGSKLEKAFLEIDRKDFIDEDHEIEAYYDYPLPIGYGQTISQPTIVAVMLSLLGLKKGERVLDVGCGSGWTTVLIGYLVEAEGEVVAVDIIQEFVELTRNRAAAYQDKAQNIAVFHASEEKAIYSDHFDKILVNASFQSEESIPQSMKEGLKEGGRMVAPIANDLIVLQKEEGKLKELKRLPYAVSFVPYIEYF